MSRQSHPKASANHQSIRTYRRFQLPEAHRGHLRLRKHPACNPSLGPAVCAGYRNISHIRGNCVRLYCNHVSSFKPVRAPAVFDNLDHPFDDPASGLVAHQFRRSTDKESIERPSPKSTCYDSPLLCGDARRVHPDTGTHRARDRNFS